MRVILFGSVQQLR